MTSETIDDAVKTQGKTLLNRSGKGVQKTLEISKNNEKFELFPILK